jgi:DHA1 family multidrug/chloramphenicol efflux transport protein-like MFS transporter
MAQPLIFISRKQAVIFACFLVMYEFLTYIANDMIMPGMLSVVQGFHAPESAVASSLTVYMLGGASLQLLLGPISDAYGRRPVMLVGACLFFIFTLIIACSYSMQTFLIARFFQGMGLCFIVVVGYATIQELFAEMDAIRFISIMANVGITAPLIGPLLGSLIILWMSWRFIFILIGFFALLALWGLWRYMPESLGQKRRDGTMTAKTPLSFNQVYTNYRQLLKNKSLVFSMLALGLIGVPCIIWIALSPILLIAKANLSVVQYGLWQIPVFAASIVGNWVLHRLTYSSDLKTIIKIGCLLVLIGLLTSAILPFFFGLHYLYLMPGIIIYFFAIGVTMAPLNRYALFVTAVSKGTASALISLTLMLIQACSIEIASLIHVQNNTLHFALYCNVAGLLFLLCVGLAFCSEPNLK